MTFVTDLSLLAAAAQPVSDKRLVEAFGTMAEGCALLMRILFTAEIYVCSHF